jgi:hypothetical protein
MKWPMLAIIFYLILASMFPQPGEATPGVLAGLTGLFHSSKGHSATLPNLTGDEKKFYETIMVPLLARCADKTFGPVGTFQKTEKEMLCKNANKLAQLYTDLNGMYKGRRRNT